MAALGYEIDSGTPNVPDLRARVARARGPDTYKLIGTVAAVSAAGNTQHSVMNYLTNGLGDADADNCGMDSVEAEDFVEDVGGTNETVHGKRSESKGEDEGVEGEVEDSEGCEG